MSELIEEVYTDGYLAGADDGNVRVECMTLMFDPDARDSWETLCFDAAGKHFIDTSTMYSAGVKVPVRRAQWVDERAAAAAALAAVRDAYGDKLTESTGAAAVQAPAQRTSGLRPFRLTTGGWIFVPRLHAVRHGLSSCGWLSEDGQSFEAL